MNNKDNLKLLKEKKNIKMNIVMIKIDNDVKDLCDNVIYDIKYRLQNEADSHSTLT